MFLILFTTKAQAVRRHLGGCAISFVEFEALFCVIDPTLQSAAFNENRIGERFSEWQEHF
jgi:hypothetical protein